MRCGMSTSPPIRGPDKWSETIRLRGTLISVSESFAAVVGGTIIGSTMRISAFRTAAALTVFAAGLSLASCAGLGEQKLTGEDSPLQAYFQDIFGVGMGFDEEQIKERERKIQESIAACMNAEGFEYFPVVSDGMILRPLPVEPDGENLWQPDKREWVEKHGYGIVNDPYRLAGGGSPDPFPMPVPGDPGEMPTDPNWEYYETLSPSEQKAYNQALYGKGFVEEGEYREGDGPVTEDQPIEEYRPEDYGCSGKANAETYADMERISKVWQDPQFTSLMDAMNELYMTYETDPKRAALEREWSGCVADAGQPVFAQRHEAENSIHQTLEPYFSKENWDESVWDLPEVQEIGRQEIALALVDFDCRAKLDYENEIMRLQFALEEQFLIDYKVELEAMKQAFEQAKAG